MDCNAIVDRIAGYLDGELARSESALFEAHLDTCGDCQKLVERVAAVDLTPPAPVAATADPVFWGPMDAALSAEHTAHDALVVAEEARPRGVRSLVQRELRVGVPVLLGYAALLLLTITWALANLSRAQHAESATTDLAQQLEREQRQSQAPQAVVPQNRTATASSRNHKF